MLPRLCYDLQMKRLGLICITLAASASATSMVALDLKALLSRADRVVLATVLSEESHWTEAHDAIYTDTLVRIDRAYKGAARAGDTVKVRREGGSVDGIGMKVHGVALLAPGEQAVLFLEQRGPSSWVVGMSQGKWPVSVENGRKVVHAADVSDIHFVQGAAPPSGTRSLADVEKLLRADRK
jgi:hypothetical protein